MNLPAHPRAVRKFANTISICTNERLGKDSKPPFDSIRVFIASWAMLWSSWGSAAGPPPSPTCKQNARIIVLHVCKAGKALQQRRRMLQAENNETTAKTASNMRNSRTQLRQEQGNANNKHTKAKRISKRSKTHFKELGIRRLQLELPCHPSLFADSARPVIRHALPLVVIGSWRLESLRNMFMLCQRAFFWQTGVWGFWLGARRQALVC